MNYLTTDELSSRIKYDPRTIRDRLIDSVLLEGRHYFRPFGGRKILFIWEHIEEDMMGGRSEDASLAIPMANGKSCAVPPTIANARGVGKSGGARSVKPSMLTQGSAPGACHG